MGIRKSLVMMALATALIAPAGAAFADNDHGRGRGHDKHDDRGRHGDRGRDRDHDDRRRDYGDWNDGRGRVVIIRPDRDRHDERRAYSHGYRNGFEDGARFADRDRQRGRDWYVRYPSYYKPIPPGHYKRAARGAYLPRGYYYEAPPVLVREFRPLPRGYGYYVVDRDIVIASVATGLILDVILGGY